MAAGWTVVVPVKGFTQAKTRLAPEFATASTRDELARAFVTDLLTALQDAPEVMRTVMVTDDPQAMALATSLGVEVADDPGTGLNAAIAAAASDAVPVAAFLGDLPCVRASDVSWALQHAADHDRSFITDAAGTGTTVLACSHGALGPAFGEHSAAAHAASGAVRIAGAAPALHRDVDTEVDLWDAVRIGVGKATRAALVND